MWLDVVCVASLVGPGRVVGCIADFLFYYVSHTPPNMTMAKHPSGRGVGITTQHFTCNGLYPPFQTSAVVCNNLQCILVSYLPIAPPDVTSPAMAFPGKDIVAPMTLHSPTDD